MSNETSLALQRQDLESVKLFLQRPVRVATYNWTSSGVVGTELFNFSFSSLLTTEPFASKLKGFRSLSADLKIRIVLSASPQQQGALYAKFLPLENNTDYYSVYNSHTRTLTSVSQLPGITIQTCHKEAHMTFPLRTPTGVIALSNPTEQQYYWGKLSVWCLDTLRTGTGSITTCNISVYANLEDIELGGPTIPQSGINPKKKKKKYSIRTIPVDSEMKQSSSLGPVSGPLLQISKASDEISGIPLLSNFSKTISWFSRAASGAARSFGFSKPVIQDPENSMALLQHLSSYNGDQGETSLVVSTCRDNEVILMDDIPGYEEDELSIDFIKKQWAYYKTTSITSSSSGIVDTINVSPTSFNTGYSYTNGAGTVTVPTRTPIGMLGSFFSYWRGGIDVKVRIIKTKFHSGTLAFIWVPSNFAGTLDDSGQAYVYTHMVDISEVDQVNLTLPYLVSAPFIPTSTISGQLYVRVINSLKYPDNVSSTISLIYEVAGADSLQFAVPTTFNGFTPVMTQAGLEESCEVSYSKFMDKQDEDLFKLTVGERITSLRQILNAYHPMIMVNSSSQPTLNSGSVYDPTAIGTSCSWPTKLGFSKYGVGFDPFNAIAMCFLFNRGSVKWRWVLDNTVGNVHVAWDVSNGFAPSTIVNSANPFPVTLSDISSGSSMRVASINSQAGGGSFTFPYLHKNIFKINIPIYSNSTTNYVSAPQITSTNGLKNIIWNIPQGSPTGYIARAIGEDFQFGYWIGVPAG